jgi:hypothetical protein
MRLLALLLPALLTAQTPTPVWKFAVSGDSRNCGDLVMPAIAQSVLKSGAAFYWHLGDFRAIYDFDEDMLPPASLHLPPAHMTIADYLTKAWPDFIANQLQPFGQLDVFLSPGNHEKIFPMRLDMYLSTFAAYLNNAPLVAQRERDHDPITAPRAYYHWVMNNSVDFVSLDNAGNNTFDPIQMEWIRARLSADRDAAGIRTIVVGMHEALPGSQAASHSMCSSPQGLATGTEVYKLLWDLQQSGKKVYVLASHSHFLMDRVFNTDYWRGQELPGWIVGTGGAVRYRLPPGLAEGTHAQTDIYGYLLGTVMSDGSVSLEFKAITLDDLRRANPNRPDPLVTWCVNENKDTRIPPATPCPR